MLDQASAPSVCDTEGRLDQLHAEFASTGDRAIRNALAVAYDSFAVSVARRFPTRRESFEDCAQVARVALIGALERFDPGRGRPFTAFARITIEGELKRHMRDRTWAMRVPRSLQEHFFVTLRTVDDLTHELGRSPQITEVARRAGLSEEAVLEAMELSSNVRPGPLDLPEAGNPRSEPGFADPAFTVLEERDLCESLIDRLPERQRQILRLRFFEGLTQREISEQVGVSQMYVSRLLARTLADLAIRANRSIACSPRPPTPPLSAEPQPAHG